MRTNIVLDDRLVREAMRLSKAQTKREVVDLALREKVRRALTHSPNCTNTSRESRSSVPLEPSICTFWRRICTRGPVGGASHRAVHTAASLAP